MRTAEELSDKLSEERIWRVKEITAVSNLAGRRNLSPVEVEFYCRAGSALFYAHWEGFVKRAATHYLKGVYPLHTGLCLCLRLSHWERSPRRAANPRNLRQRDKPHLKYVAFQRVKVSEMSDFVMCLFMRQNLGVSSTPSTTQLLKISHQLQSQQDFRPKLNWKNVIQTDSNLSSNVLKRIMVQLGLDYSLFATKAMVIDGIIIKHRNAVAHGEKGEVDVDMLREIGTQVISMITLFRDLIENAVSIKAHVK